MATVISGMPASAVVGMSGLTLPRVALVIARLAPSTVVEAVMGRCVCPTRPRTA
jgi:hypothetical protein